eukprot:1012532-Rhodomonas_salina.2
MSFGALVIVARYAYAISLTSSISRQEKARFLTLLTQLGIPSCPLKGAVMDPTANVFGLGLTETPGKKHIESVLANAGTQICTARVDTVRI